MQPLTPISTSNPHTPAGEYMGGIAAVCPELTIESLVNSLMENLDDTFAPDCALIIHGDDGTEKLTNCRSLPFSALDYYRKVLHAKVNKPFPLDRSNLYGCAIEFGKGFKCREGPPDDQAIFAKWLENGLLCTNIEWHYVFMRCQYLVTVLATFIDEIRRVLKDESIFKTKMLAPLFNEIDASGDLVCLNCKRPPVSGNKLLSCGKWYSNAQCYISLIYD